MDVMLGDNRKKKKKKHKNRVSKNMLCLEEVIEPNDCAGSQWSSFITESNMKEDIAFRRFRCSCTCATNMRLAY